jgi:hypothetical protein
MSCEQGCHVLGTVKKTGDKMHLRVQIQMLVLHPTALMEYA